MCKYCQPRKEITPWDNIRLAFGDYTSLYLRPTLNGRLVLVAYGEGEAKYYPKYCPECGRKLDDSK